MAKFTSAFLEVRWSWPRHHEPLTQFCYLLTDPRSQELDTIELGRLSDELQTRLFGTGADEAVTLLLFEGPEDAMEVFAEMPSEAVARAIQDPTELPAGGRLSQIARDGTKLQTGPQPIPETTVEARLQAMPPLEGVQGIYFTSRQYFVGDVVAYTPGASRTYFSLVDGDEHLPPDPAAFDADCVTTARRLLLETNASGVLYLPVCFSTLMRPTQRAAYMEALATLATSEKRRLGAAVYGVPRAPSFTAIAQLHATLDEHFAAIDLRTNDPAFEIEQLPPKAATSVTLVLPKAEPRQRLAALKSFATRVEQYKRRQIWPAITNIRSTAELDAAVKAAVPFVTGPAVCRMQTSRYGGRPWPMERLPVLSA